jgi:hypothetical protein
MNRQGEFMILHHVTGTGWVHTHGLASLGLPELEVRGVPDFLAEDAARLLNLVAGYMRKKRVKLGETMATSPRTSFRFIKADPIPGNEDHYEDERWQIVDVETVCECCDLRSHEKN